MKLEDLKKPRTYVLSWGWVVIIAVVVLLGLGLQLIYFAASEDNKVVFDGSCVFVSSSEAGTNMVFQCGGTQVNVTNSKTIIQYLTSESPIMVCTITEGEYLKNRLSHCKVTTEQK